MVLRRRARAAAEHLRADENEQGLLRPGRICQHLDIYVYVYIHILSIPVYLYLYLYVSISISVSVSIYLSIYIYIYIYKKTSKGYYGQVDGINTDKNKDHHHDATERLRSNKDEQGLLWSGIAVDNRGRGQASWGATLALPLSPFAEQLALGFNPSPAAAVGGGCRYARGRRFAHL